MSYMRQIIVIIATMLAIMSCKKEQPIESICTSNSVEKSNEWVFVKTLFVTRDKSTDNITWSNEVNSLFNDLDHKLENGIYYQSSVGANTYIQKGTYTQDSLYYNIGNGRDYVKSINNSDQLILEKLVGGTSTTYITEENIFNRKK